MKRKILATFAAIALGMAASAALAADKADVQAAAATNGGKILVHSALFPSLNTDIMNGFNEKFSKDGLEVNVVRVQTGKQTNLYDQEIRANKVSVDVLFMVDPGVFLRFQKEGKLTPFCSEHFANYRDGMVASDCSHFFVTAYYQYIGYNPEVVTGADIPKSWTDLYDPKFKGRFSVPDPKVGGGHYFWVFTMYKLFGKEFFEKIAANEPLLTQSHGVTHNQLMSGERVIGVDLSVLVRRDGPYPGGKGSPVKEAFPMEGGALLPGAMAITKGGPNTAGAKVFIDWAASLEGQKVINKLGHFSLRKDFTSVEGDDLSKIPYHWWDAAEMDKFRDEYTTESIKLLTGG